MDVLAFVGVHEAFTNMLDDLKYLKPMTNEQKCRLHFYLQRKEFI